MKLPGIEPRSGNLEQLNGWNLLKKDPAACRKLHCFFLKAHSFADLWPTLMDFSIYI
jgi:hypothetical protein